MDEKNNKKFKLPISIRSRLSPVGMYSFDDNDKQAQDRTIERDAKDVERIFLFHYFISGNSQSRKAVLK